MKPQHKHHHPLPKRRNNYLIILLIVVIMLLSVIIGFLLLRPPFPPQPPHGHHAEPFPPDERVLNINGVVSSFSADNHADVNGFNIRLPSKKFMLINFKPHMARKIMSAAGVNSHVKIAYVIRDGRDKTKYELVEITNVKTNAVIPADGLPPPPPGPGNETAKTYIIINPQLVYDTQGNLAGLRYKHQLFQLPPGQVSSIKELITKTSKLDILAAARDKAGFVNINGDDVFQVINITIGAQTFLLR